MLARVPGWLVILVWICVGIVVLIIVGLIVHALGGGILDLHAGHFIFEVGAT